MPKPAVKTPFTVDDLLQSASLEFRPLVEQIRTVIRETVPEAIETANPTWRSISYRHPLVGYFCGVFPELERINVAFEFGVLLPDPAGALEGSGEQVRYLRVRRPEDLQAEVLKELLQAAISLPSEREARLALIRSSARPVGKTEPEK